MTALFEPNKAIERLRALRAEADKLPHEIQSAEFSSWSNRVQSVLTKSLGADHHITTAFVNLHWTPSMYTLTNPGPEFERTFVATVPEAQGLLDAAIFELQDFSQSAPETDAAVVLTPAEVRELERLVGDLRNAVDSGQLPLQGEEATEFDLDLKAAEDQLRSPKPKRGIVRASLRSLALLMGALTLSVAGNAVYAGLLDLLKKL